MMIEIDIDPGELIRGVPQNELLEFIVDADLTVADASFTEELITRLVHSLATDSKTDTLVMLSKLTETVRNDF